jgi:D-serine deaminase-like pyridoxal phosphate-dependent protein
MAVRFPEMNFIPSAGILTRVVSKGSGRLTLDVGHKSCAADQPFGKRLFFPSLSDASEVMHSEEHLVIESANSDQFRLGDAIVAIPRHVCPVSAVHQFATVVENGKATGRWKIAARDRVLTI